MKVNRLIIAVALLFTMAKLSPAQDYKIPVDNSNNVKVSLINFTDDIPIEGYNGKEIIITSASETVVVPDRAKGLRPVYSAGTDNTGMGLSVEKSGNEITITCLLPLTKRGSYKIKLPDNLAVKYESGCERAGDISIQNMKNEIEIKTCQAISLKNVSGPVVLSTIGGDIEVVFSGALSQKPCSISTVGGEIDVTLPAKAAVDLDLKSMSGTIYSDFDFPASDKKMKPIGGGNSLNYKLNGGGFGLNLVTIGGNVYVRKGQ